MTAVKKEDEVSDKEDDCSFFVDDGVEQAMIVSENGFNEIKNNNCVEEPVDSVMSYLLPLRCGTPCRPCNWKQEVLTIF